MAKRVRTPATTTPAPLPDIQAALNDVTRFQIRALVSLGARIVLLGLLVTLLSRQNPSWEAASPWLHAGATVLAVWPSFTAQGKLWAGRIRLGRSYADAGRFDDAARLLAPLARPAARAFDARREGTLLLARAFGEQGQTGDACRLLDAVTRETGDGSVREQAAALLRNYQEKEAI